MAYSANHEGRASNSNRRPLTSYDKRVKCKPTTQQQLLAFSLYAFCVCSELLHTEHLGRLESHSAPANTAHAPCRAAFAGCS
eukprot:1196055-Prymnesium_polylepis.2